VRLRTGRTRAGALAIALFLAALVPRITQPAAFVAGDELTWSHRSARFLTALSGGRLADTSQAGHPGVTTMWLDTIGLVLSPDVDRAALAEIAARPVVGDPDSLRLLAELLFASKWMVGLVTAIGIGLMYLLARRLVSDPAALLGAVLVTFDPFLLAHSRVLHLDALLTTFMALSVLALLIWNQTPAKKTVQWLILSGVFAGLAALTKATALFLIPFAGLVLFFAGGDEFAGRRVWLRRVQQILLAGIVWSLGLVVTYVVLWPAMWVDPAGTLQQVLGRAFTYAETAHESNFFWGANRPDPGPAFYPVVLAYRLTPVTLIGLAAGVAALWSNWRHHRQDVLRWLLAFVILFTLFMTMGAKKGDRYILPVFPMIDLLVGIGLWQLAHSRWRRADGSSATGPLPSAIGYWVALPVVQALLVLPYHPYYLSYFNPLADWGQATGRTLEVGWGEGMEQAAAYLNTKAQGRPQVAAVWVVASFAPYYAGSIQHISGFDPATTDYVVLYVSQVQRHIFGEVIDRFWPSQVPEVVVRIHGLDYAWVYPNLSYQAPLRYLSEKANPATDIVVTGTPSIFTRHYTGSTPLVIAESVDEAAVMRRLAEAVAGKHRAWYVRYHTPRAGPEDLAGYALATHAYQLNQVDLGDVDVTAYLLPDVPDFSATPIDPIPTVDFGNQVALTGGGIIQRDAQWGRRVGVALKWQALAQPADDYTVFIQMMDDDGRLWGQADDPLRNTAGQPTSGWSPGDRVTAHHAVTLQPGIPPGDYWLDVGLYRWPDGKRLDRLDAAGNPIGTTYRLGRVHVAPSVLFPAPDSLEIGQRLNIPAGDGLKLLGVRLGQDRARSGETLPVTLYWQAQSPPAQADRLRLRLVGSGGQVQSQVVLPLAHTGYPTHQWRAGEVIRGEYRFNLPPDVLTGQSTLTVELVDATGQPLGHPIRLGEIDIEAVTHQMIRPSMQTEVGARFGEQIILAGYDLATEGKTIAVNLYWQALGSTAVSYTAFVHVLGPDGRIVGQIDQVPAGGTRPTTGWVAGEYITDSYRMPLPLDAPMGTYRIEAGLYNPATLQRLPVFDAQGNRLPEDRVLLDQEVQMR